VHDHFGIHCGPLSEEYTPAPERDWTSVQHFPAPV
jgi:hypothetical protein